MNKTLTAAPLAAPIEKTLRALNLSAAPVRELTTAPMTKPNCTDAVNKATSMEFRCHRCARGEETTEALNHTLKVRISAMATSARATQGEKERRVLKLIERSAVQGGASRHCRAAKLGRVRSALVPADNPCCQPTYGVKARPGHVAVYN